MAEVLLFHQARGQTEGSAPGAREAVFGTTWPADVPVQIHAMERVLDFLRGR